MGMRAPAPKKKPRQGSAPQEDEAPDFPDPADFDDCEEPDALDFRPEDFDEEAPDGLEDGGFDAPHDDFGLDEFDEPAAAAPFRGEHDKGVSVSEPPPKSPTRGWYCALFDRYIGRAVPVPHWYMRAESDAVHEGVQKAATCGLHAVNHALRPLGTVHTWGEFDSRCGDGEWRPSGDWEFGTLHRNILAAGEGRALRPVLPDEYADLARWNPDRATLTLWTQDVLGCVMHVPGHWVALTRPDGPQTAACAALLCDSLHRQPYALGVEEVGELLACIAMYQRNAAEGAAGVWSLNVVA